MVVLENSVLIGLTRNDAIRKEFPAIANLYNAIKTQATTKPATGCGGCGGGMRGPSGLDYNSIKSAIATMPDASKLRFLQLTGWDKVKVIYTVGGHTKTVTF